MFHPKSFSGINYKCKEPFAALKEVKYVPKKDIRYTAINMANLTPKRLLNQNVLKKRYVIDSIEGTDTIIEKCKLTTSKGGR